MIDFEALFVIEGSVLETIVRSTILYFGILFLMRILPRRTGGELAMMDLIFVLLIAEAATHSIGDYTSITEGFIAIGTLMTWDYLVNWLSFHIPMVERMFSAPPVQIIKRGKILRRNMRSEYITEEELEENIRKKGLEDISQVKHAFVEGDGKITIVPVEE